MKRYTPKEFKKKLNKVYCIDAIEGMQKIPDRSVDMVFCDLPYGTTACSWDIVILFDKLWEQWERILTDIGTVVLTSSQPFTTDCINSKRDLFKYTLVWVKSRPTGFQHAKNKPLKIHEDIIVFSKGTTVHKGQSRNRMKYNFVGVRSIQKFRKYTRKKFGTIIGHRPSHKSYAIGLTGYPNSVLRFDSESGSHPTQKPVALFRRLIEFYTDVDDVILDCCIGSGTTAVAAKMLKRNFIGFDIEKKYIEIAKRRLKGVPAVDCRLA